MVESGQRPGIVDVAYDNPDRVRVGIEVLTFDALKARLRSSVAQRPSRVDFHQLMLVRRGAGTAMVDFDTYPCAPGTLLHLRPGQVQRLPVGAEGRPADLDAVLLLFTADFPLPPPATRDVLDGFGPVAWRLPPGEFDVLDRAVTELQTEYRRLRDERAAAPAALADTGVELTEALLRHLLRALLIRLSRLPDPTGHAVAPAAPGADVYAAFRHELERSFAVTRSVEDYARRLGYSPRTVTRACLAATGRSAKQLADARVALEARRLLAHTDLPVSVIGRALGFTEATNFGKFFVRETGRTPGAFRRGQR
ncbi:helix-turn-helix domain-containing protein [Yinghuangia seranimata]|uniref:helix-turn-helix domain-containing protein n=1 Tax=Yinghuangia seranimata TaxID=408067 RepID=UPI00248D1B72|nr:AraC family transcriptional regulator [Yinghuangia seranimata]MDI2126543.1 AraC family transcriptional regulator [Yinghuangia seranimata]